MLVKPCSMNPYVLKLVHVNLNNILFPHSRFLSRYIPENVELNLILFTELIFFFF